MSKNVAFTIVAKNYIGLATILKDAVHQHNDDVDFFIFVVDKFEKEVNLPDGIVFAQDELDIPDSRWRNMSFKYDLTEFCTAVKPFCFNYLFNKNYDKAIYFDPDINIFSSLIPIYDILDSSSVVLTPQIAGIHTEYKGELPEYYMMQNGIFNMGFCAMKCTPAIRHFIDWWCVRLETMCFAERSMGYFTDQKWIDWLPGFLDSRELHVSRSLGMNLAPWNFFERRVIEKNGEFFVEYRGEDNPQRCDKLVFLHYAGYDYNCFKRGVIKRKRIESLQEYDDLQGVLAVYRDRIQGLAGTFDMFINQTYSYATYDNGDPIEKFHRRIYNGLQLSEQYDPFKTGKGTFHEELRRKKLLGGKERVDKVNKTNLPNLDKKIKLVNRFFSVFEKIIGYKKYILFVRGLITYSNMESHYFLINKSNICR